MANAHKFLESNDDYNLNSWGVPGLGVPIIFANSKSYFYLLLIEIAILFKVSNSLDMFAL